MLSQPSYPLVALYTCCPRLLWMGVVNGKDPFGLTIGIKSLIPSHGLFPPVLRPSPNPSPAWAQPSGRVPYPQPDPVGPPNGRKCGKPRRATRRVVGLRVRHEEAPRRPPLRRATTTTETSATTAAGLVTLLGSATSRGVSDLRRAKAQPGPHRTKAQLGLHCAVRGE
jgi:hypothetical protein